MDENVDGGSITSVATENATAVTVDDERFEVADGSLKLKAGTSLDFEAGESPISVTITASGDGDSATATVSVTVNDVNEAPGAPVVVAASPAVDENAAGASISSVEAAEDPEGGAVTYHVDDDRFEVDDGLVLKLKDGESLDHESESSVTLTVTARDADGNESGATTVTVAVNDVNEGPVVLGAIADITAVAGTAVNQEIDLLALFGDPDEGDAVVSYELSDAAPSWMRLEVQFGEDEDGQKTATGYLRGTPPTTGPDSENVHNAGIVASDAGGATGTADFRVITDDGNDRIESITLFELADDDGNEAVNVNYVLEVDENVSGQVFGRITVTDPDNPLHPHGKHEVTVNNPNFEIREDDDGGLWLALKADASLDYEKEGGSVTVVVMAEDNGGDKGNTFSSPGIRVTINDKNDAPTAAETIGNWWVTIDADLDAEDAAAGEWLSFSLETPGDANPAFGDEDLATGGDKLSYSISGAPWIQIDADTGAITNKAEMIAERGVYQITVTATDQGEDRADDDNADGQSASVSFTLYVALSDEARAGVTNSVDADNTLIDDNEEPSIEVPRDVEYLEGSGDQRIATIRVEDQDQDIESHPFSIVKVEIVSAKSRDASDTTDYTAVFKLDAEPVKNGSVWTYGLNVNDAAGLLDYEKVKDIELTIEATDGVGASVQEEVDIEIVDANEAPVATVPDGYVDLDEYLDYQEASTVTDEPVTSDSGKTKLIYIDLFALWEDGDDDDDDDDLTFGASTSTSWIEFLHGGPVEWGDISDGADGVAGNDDDPMWQNSNTDSAPADANTMVLVIELDNSKHKPEGENGSIVLTAQDEGGAVGETKVTILPDESHRDLEAVAVTLSGGSNPREGDSLQASFDEEKDPDLAGSYKDASLVYYVWQRVAPDSEGNPGTASVPFAVTTDTDSIALTQEDVGNFIRVTVKYYEIAGSILWGNISDDTPAYRTATTTTVVANSQDRGTGEFSILTNATNDGLTAAAVLYDEDYIDDQDDSGSPDNVDYTWEVSNNGRGGWTEVSEDEADEGDLELSLADGEGKYYRVVATYDGDGDTEGTPGDDERIASDAIQVGKLAAPDPAPTIIGSPNPGGTLIVQNADGASLQWQSQQDDGSWADIPNATGDLALDSTHAGLTVRAVATYSGDSGVTAVVLATLGGRGDGAVQIGGVATDIAPVKIADHTIEVNVDLPFSSSPGGIYIVRRDDITVRETLSVTETVDIRSLFQDPDSAHLTFAVQEATTGPDLEPDHPTYVGKTAHRGYPSLPSASESMLVFEPSSGKLTFVSILTHGHDGIRTDGAGNVIEVKIGANDDGGTNAEAEASVFLRINVAPRDITFTDEVSRIKEDDATTGGSLVAKLNVLDENSTDHKFGTHVVTVDDARFEIVDDEDGDGSTWELKLKEGATVDYDALEDADADTAGKQLKLTFVATDGGGLSTPDASTGAFYSPITLLITITNDTSDDPKDPPPVDPVPGLKDNDGDSDDTTDGDDTDTDGGLPPPPGASIGAVIEDYIDGMDVFEQDLLEDFMLVIDDGLDIA